MASPKTLADMASLLLGFAPAATIIFREASTSPALISTFTLTAVTTLKAAAAFTLPLPQRPLFGASQLRAMPATIRSRKKYGIASKEISLVAPYSGSEGDKGNVGPRCMSSLPDLSDFAYRPDEGEVGGGKTGTTVVTPECSQSSEAGNGAWPLTLDDAASTVGISDDASSEAVCGGKRFKRRKAVKVKPRSRLKIEPKAEADIGIIRASGVVDDSLTTLSTLKKHSRHKSSSESPKSSAQSKRTHGSPKKSPGSSSRKRPRIEPGSLDPPKAWESIYELVREIRSDRSAPVDNDGGEALPQRDRGEKVWRFQVLVALMLSSQTKDAVVGETMRALQEWGLDVQHVHRVIPEDLNGLIGKVGFHNNKTKYLKQTAEILLESHDGDIPKTAAELMNLPGVGPKMAYIIESVAFGITSGIGVDTHMHRIFNDLGWVKSKTPEQTREQLEGWLPRDKWSEINVLWVGIGQETQQQREKALRKALGCTQPRKALALYRKIGMDVNKEAKKCGLLGEVEKVLNNE